MARHDLQTQTQLFELREKLSGDPNGTKGMKEKYAPRTVTEIFRKYQGEYPNVQWP